jgi:hypothetical protein
MGTFFINVHILAFFLKKRRKCDRRDVEIWEYRDTFIFDWQNLMTCVDVNDSIDY